MALYNDLEIYKDTLLLSKYLHQRIYKLTNKYYRFGIGEEVCAAALYEMTFHGYTEEKVEKEYSYLEKSFEELKF